MNIVDRSALWFRLERIGQEMPPESVTITPQPVTQPTNKDVLDTLHQQLVRANELENRLNLHIDASKKRAKDIETKKAQPTKYKGLAIEKPHD